MKRSSVLRVRVASALLFLAVFVQLLAVPRAGALSQGAWTKGPNLPSGYVPKWDVAYAYMPTTDQVVLFGGAPKATGETWSNLTWIYHAGAWSQGPAAPSGLTQRGGAAMAYLPTTNKVVLFGGAGSSWPPFNQTWLWDGTKWTAGPAAPADLLGRTGAKMVYDPDIGKLVLFGGSGASVYRDTWLFDGTQWTAGPTPPGTMEARSNFGMTYDATLHQVVVAGGSGTTTVWTFDGTKWAAGPAMPSLMGPKERINLAYSPQQLGDLVFGGLGPGSTKQDLWLLSGGVWSQLNQGSSKPAARLDAGLVWLPTTSKLMLFGGVDDGNSGKTGFMDTWFWSSSFVGNGGVGARGSSKGSLESILSSVPRGRTIHPSVADGQVTAHDDQFWLGTQPIVLKGVNDGATDGVLADMQQIKGWGMNFVRLRIHWADLEPNPPVKVGGVWVHTYDPEATATMVNAIASAYENGIYTLVDNHPCSDDEACSYFGYPEWSYTAAYNSHAKTYAKTLDGVLQAQSDFWSDALRQQFQTDMWTYVVNQVKASPGIMGYEVLNEPQPGTLAKTHTTTQLMLDWQLGAAAKIRALDPARVIVFTTRTGFGPGLPNADLSGWTSLGNVAFDLHDYFGARWGWGLNMNPSSPDFAESTGILYNHTANGQSGPYIGSVFEQARMIANRRASLAGFPIFLGEVGDRSTDPGIYHFFGSSLFGANYAKASWAVDYGGDLGFTDSNKNLLPWGYLVLEAV